MKIGTIIAALLIPAIGIGVGVLAVSKLKAIQTEQAARLNAATSAAAPAAKPPSSKTADRLNAAANLLGVLGQNAGTFATLFH